MQPTQFIPRTTPTAPPRPRRRRRWHLHVTVAVLSAALAVVATLSLQKATGAGTFDVHGTVDVTGVFGGGSPGAACDTSGQPGAADLAPGGQVVVYDAAGRALAFGTLREGTLRGDGCVMPFTVAGIPDGVGPWFVEVTHRGRIGFTRAQAGAVTLAVALG